MVYFYFIVYAVLVIQVEFKFQTLSSLYSVVGLLRRRLRSCCHIGIQWNSMESHFAPPSVKQMDPLVILLILVIQGIVLSLATTLQWAVLDTG